MNNIATLDILTESDAWLLLEKTLADDIPIDAEVFRLRIGSWPVLHLKLDGENFQSSISTKMMVAFLELQKNIYRAYAKMKYDIANGRLLTNEDKAALELMIQVNQGSSEFWAYLEDLGKKLVEGAIVKMEAKHYVILSIATILTIGGTVAINKYIVEQTERKQIEAQISLSKEETRRLEIMREASRQVPYVGTNIDMTEEVVNKIFKGAATAESITIGGHTFNKEQVGQLIRAERSISTEVRLDGEYRILKVDSSNIDFFRVELRDDTGRKFWAELKDYTVTKEKNKELLQEAEWNKKPINLVINGKEVKGEITSASIIDVKDRLTGK